MLTTAFLAAVVAAVAAIVFIATKLFAEPKPKEENFVCSRCNALSRHTNRTIEAWRAGKTKFYCDACHLTWLRSHHSPRPVPGPATARLSPCGLGGRPP